MQNLQITKQGLEAAASIADQGFRIKLTRFRLADGTGYTPAPDGSETDLHGNVVYTAPISGYTIEPEGELKLVLRIPAPAGTFNFGEIAIDAEITPGNFLMFASAVTPTMLLKESSLSVNAPSIFTFNCYIRMKQGVTIIEVVPGDVNAGGVDYQVQINNLQQQINNMSTPENFQPQIDAINLQLYFITNELSLKPSLATYSELSSASPPVDKAVAANHLRNKAADNLIQLTPGGLYLPQASIIGLSGGLPTYTGPTVFSNADNSVVCSGLVSALDLEVGDVVKVEQSSLGNNKLFTVTSITDNNNLKFNERHSMAKNSYHTLMSESTVIKFTRMSKWYNAPLGLGQSWTAATDMTLAPSTGALTTAFNLPISNRLRSIEVTSSTLAGAFTPTTIRMDITHGNNSKSLSAVGEEYRTYTPMWRTATAQIEMNVIPDIQFSVGVMGGGWYQLKVSSRELS